MNGLQIRPLYRDNPFNYRALAYETFFDLDQSKCFRLRWFVLGPMQLGFQQQSQQILNLVPGSYILRVTDVAQDAALTTQNSGTGLQYSLTDLGTGIRFFSNDQGFYGAADIDTPNSAAPGGWLTTKQIILSPGKVSVVAHGTFMSDPPALSFLVFWVAEPMEGW